MSRVIAFKCDSASIFIIRKTWLSAVLINGVLLLNPISALDRSIAVVDSGCLFAPPPHHQRPQELPWSAIRRKDELFCQCVYNLRQKGVPTGCFHFQTLTYGT